jgi:lysophospholipase L1-like esterase/poly(3-hydroxybutyrate) depolymerase
MKTLLSCALLIAGISCVASSAPPPFTQGSVDVNGATIPYLLLPPKSMEEGKRYPLVLFLHGAGERGNDNLRQIGHFSARMASEWYRDRYNCFVLAPQCPLKQRWANLDPGTKRMDPEPTHAMQGAIASLEDVVRTQPIDLDRIMLTGLSLGGFGTFDLAARHPDYFAAAAPVCGGGDPTTAARFAGLPVIIWHGAADQVVPVEFSKNMAEAIEALDLDVAYTELPGVRHNSWDNAYARNGCIDDLFEARRDPAAMQRETARLLAEAIAPDERIAFLGDSITQAGNRPGGYVDLIRQVLADERPDAVVIPAGISGHKVPDLLARFKKDVIDQDATLVFIYIGINDVWHSTSGKGTPPDVFERGLHTLIQDLQASGATVVLATPNTIGEKPLGENDLDAMLEEFSAISRRVAKEENVTLCDLRLGFQDHLRIFNPSGMPKGILTSDGVHLNAAGNVFVATEAARALREARLSPTPQAAAPDPPH